VGIIGNFIALTAPPLSGFAVSRMPGMSGYMTIFVVSLTTFLCAAAVCRKLPSQPTGRSGNVVWGLLRYDWRDRRILFILVSFIFYGIRDGVFSYYLNLMIYQMASGGGGTLILGFNITGRSLVCMGVYWLLSAKLTREQGLAGMVVFALAWPAVVATLHFWHTPMSVFLFSAADMGVQHLVYNGMQVTSYDLSDALSREAGGASRRIEVIGARNALLCFGRVIGCALFLMIPAAGAYPVWALTGLSVLAAPGALFAQRTHALIQADDGREPAG